MENCIVIKSATKKYKEYTVLDQVSIEFERNKIHGIIGRNGCGKTMLFKCICGFVPLTSGEIFVNTQKIGKDIDVPADVGILIESPGFLPNYSAYSNLKFLASIKHKVNKETIRGAISRVGLDPDSRKHVGKYSMGMRQRLGIAQAIMEDPEILILDEPMNGLDKHGVEEIRFFLRELRDAGKTIILTSHNAQDIELLCDTVHEMDAGRITN